MSTVNTRKDKKIKCKRDENSIENCKSERAAYVAYSTHVVASLNALLRPEEAAAKVKRIWRLAEATRQSGAYALETKNNMKTKQLRMRRAVLGAPKPLRTPIHTTPI